MTKGFWLGQYEVTQGEYKRITGSNPSKFKEAGDRAPVENVSWEDATNFAMKLTERERAAGRLPDGYMYGLPTEAQWEYAARAGTRTAFRYGDSLSSRQANFDGNYPYGGGGKGPYLKKTVEVGSYEPNQWRLYDMHGNLWEWCSDWYGEYPTGRRVDPKGPESGWYRVRRGGGWENDAQFCRSASRGRGPAVYRYEFLGFRLCLRKVQN